MAARVLVTGAAGFIGARLAVAFSSAGWAVTALDARPVPAEVAESCEVLLSDYRAAAVDARIRAGQFRAVVHQAAISNTLEQDWSKLEAVNVLGTLGLAESCREGGAALAYASSFSVYGRTEAVPVAEDAVASGHCSGPLNLYARSKLATDTAMAAADTEATDTDLAWYALRYTNVFGRDEWLDGRSSSIISQIVDRAARAEPITLFEDTLDAARDYVPIGAVAAAVSGLLDGDAPSGCYNVGAGHAVSFATLLDWCADFRGGRAPEVRLVPNPIPDRYQYWTQADVAKLRAAVPAYPINGLDEIYAEARRRFDWATRERDGDR